MLGENDLHNHNAMKHKPEFSLIKKNGRNAEMTTNNHYNLEQENMELRMILNEKR
jgi:hypothetical protein